MNDTIDCIVKINGRVIGHVVRIGESPQCGAYPTPDGEYPAPQWAKTRQVNTLDEAVGYLIGQHVRDDDDENTA